MSDDEIVDALEEILMAKTMAGFRPTLYISSETDTDCACLFWLGR